MNITIKKTLDVTPPLETYIEEKLMPLSQIREAVRRDGVVELRLEVSRSSKHHRKGDEIFMARADLRLPGKILRERGVSRWISGKRSTKCAICCTWR